MPHRQRDVALDTLRVGEHEAPADDGAPVVRDQANAADIERVE